MKEDVMTQRQFLEAYDSGIREFSSVYIQFFDIASRKFSNLAFRDSKIMFCTFRDCEFTNVMFDSCDIYCGSFYSGRMTNAIFSNCQIELTLFESIIFATTKMDKCNIRLSAIFNSNHASVDVSTSTAVKLLTDPSQVTREDIESSVKETMAEIERLDIGTKMKIKEIFRQDMERYGIKGKEKKEGYEVKGKNYEDDPLTYGEVKSLIETAFGAYGPQAPYKSKKTGYERKDRYS